MTREPAAFMSYARFNDEHDDGQLSRFKERLAAEVRAQIGREFVIFQDRADIEWGESWQQRIDDTLDVVTLLLVIVTPGFFASQACRAEVLRFLERERMLGRPDLILPVYYISAREIDDLEVQESDEVARALASRQFVDWRELRFESLASPQVRRSVASLASRMRDTFWHPASRPGRPAEERGQQAEATAGQVEQAETEGLAAAKTEPPTHVVDPWYRGDFSTVTAAITGAKSGDRILVRPGLYEESLVVDKPLEILGDGPVAEIVIRARGANALHFGTTIGRVANLTLHQAGGEGDWHGVDIVQGRLDLEGCDISSQSLACVAIRNGADPRLRRNRIHDGKASGVFVYDGGLGTLEDNDIFGNTLAGVETTTEGNPMLRGNRIRDGKENGVFIRDGGLGTLEDNDISGNTYAGVEIKTGGNPTLRRNRIHDGKVSGVFVHNDGLGTLEDNDIFGNALAGVRIETGGNPTLRGNQIHDGMEGGVLVYDDGLGVLEDNDIFGNALSGVEIKTGGNPTVRRNRIHDGKEDGVFVHNDGLGVVEDNDILANGLAGVEIKIGGNPTVRRNRIHQSKGSGVFIHNGGRGVLEDNDLTDNARGAWNIGDDCEDNVTRARNIE